MNYERIVAGYERDFASYVLCTQLYHCTPSELDEQDYQVISKHLIISDQVKREKERKMNYSKRRR